METRLGKVIKSYNMCSKLYATHFLKTKKLTFKDIKIVNLPTTLISVRRKYIFILTNCETKDGISTDYMDLIVYILKKLG